MDVIENFLAQYLKSKLGDEKGQRLVTRYVTARDKLLSDILPWIATQEPNLTDHGEKHVANVLENARLLLGIQDSTNSDWNLLNPIELYLLCMTALFHDVGNLFGRNRHNHNIAQIHGAVFNGLFEEEDEKLSVIMAARAHCGTSLTDGSKDTLKELGTMYVYGKTVRLQIIAAIIRFADELAEGPQRTSNFLIENKIFSTDSIKFHDYARMVRVNIDKQSERIALSYHINLGSCRGDGELSTNLTELENRLKLIYSRITKLDQERRYARYYCEFLSPFKETSINITIWAENWIIEPLLPPLILNDLIIPGKNVEEIEKYCPEYSINSVLERVREHVTSHSTAGNHKSGDHNEPI